MKDKKIKMASYSSYILVSNEIKQTKNNIVQTGIVLDHTPTISHNRLRSVTHTHTHTHTLPHSRKNISITNPICLTFFCSFFSHIFFRQVQIFKFFIIHFSIALAFIYKCKKNAEQEKYQQCLFFFCLRKDLLSDKVQPNKVPLKKVAHRLDRPHAREAHPPPLPVPAPALHVGGPQLCTANTRTPTCARTHTHAHTPDTCALIPNK